MIQKLENLKLKTRNVSHQDLRHVVEELINILIDNKDIIINKPIDSQVETIDYSTFGVDSESLMRSVESLRRSDLLKDLYAQGIIKDPINIEKPIEVSKKKSSKKK